MEQSKQEKNYFSHFQASDQKASFTYCFSFNQTGSKLIFKTGNGIILTGNIIISPTSRPPIKKLLLQHIFYLFQSFQNWFQNRKRNYPNRKWNYFSHFQASDQKTYFTKCFSFVPRGSKSTIMQQNCGPTEEWPWD